MSLKTATAQVQMPEALSVPFPCMAVVLVPMIVCVSKPAEALSLSSVQPACGVTLEALYSIAQTPTQSLVDGDAAVPELALTLPIDALLAFVGVASSGVEPDGFVHLMASIARNVVPLVVLMVIVLAAAIAVVATHQKMATYPCEVLPPSMAMANVFVVPATLS